MRAPVEGRTVKGSSATLPPRRGRSSGPFAQEPSELSDGHDELDPLVTELDHGDPLHEALVEVLVVLDVAFDEVRYRETPRPPVVEDQPDRLARLLAQAASGAR